MAGWVYLQDKGVLERANEDRSLVTTVGPLSPEWNRWWILRVLLAVFGEERILSIGKGPGPEVPYDEDRCTWTAADARCVRKRDHRGFCRTVETWGDGKARRTHSYYGINFPNKRSL